MAIIENPIHNFQDNVEYKFVYKYFGCRHRTDAKWIFKALINNDLPDLAKFKKELEEEAYLRDVGFDRKN